MQTKNLYTNYSSLPFFYIYYIYFLRFLWFKIMRLGCRCDDNAALSVSRKRLLWKHISIFFYFFNFWSLKGNNSCCGCWQNDAFWLSEFSMHLSQSWSLTGHMKCQIAVMHHRQQLLRPFFCHTLLWPQSLFWNSTKSGWKTWHMKCKNKSWGQKSCLQSSLNYMEGTDLEQPQQQKKKNVAVRVAQSPVTSMEEWPLWRCFRLQSVSLNFRDPLCG